MKPVRARTEDLKLGDAVAALLEECRMVLPGVQALFGFQLIAVFNQGFSQRLTPVEQQIHLLALGLVAIAGALVMAPAAYHRQTAPHEASDGFILLASRLLLIAMIPLMLGIALDFYLIARIVLGNAGLSFVLALLLALIFATAWYALPHFGPALRMTGKE